MTNIIWVKIEDYDYYKLLNKLNLINIFLYEIKEKNNYILIKISYEDYLKIVKYMPLLNMSIYSKTGIAKIKEALSKYIIFVISLILAIILILLSNNIVFKVDIKTNNSDVYELIKEELNNNGLKVFSFKLKHSKIESIVNNILDNNDDVLEWMEIEYDGAVMIVYVTEKVTYEKEQSYDNCDIVAKKDATITGLSVSEGVIVKDINDYVSKGDVIVTGSIIYNEEVKSTVCANALVYGEVWYKIKVTMPLDETYKEYTGKTRYNISINDTYLFKNRLTTYDADYTTLYELNNFNVSLVKEKEYEVKSKTLTEVEAYDKALEEALEKLKSTLAHDEEILYQNVLKKEVNDSTIYLEVFVSVKENIGEVKVVLEDMLDDKGNNTKNS